MSYARPAHFKLTWSRALLLASLPLACATEVKPEFEDGDYQPPADTAGTSAGGTEPEPTAGTSNLPLSGTTSMGGTEPSNSTGGKSSGGTSTGGKASGGASTGGTASGGASGGKASGGASTGGKASGGASTGGSASGGASTGGKAGSSTGGATGGSGTGGCTCPTKKTWVDNSNLAFEPGDCLDVAGDIYLYTGSKDQTWANKDCNPAKQLAWCSDVGADYKFMLCK